MQTIPYKHALPAPSFASSPILPLGSHASVAKSAPLGQSAYCKNIIGLTL